MDYLDWLKKLSELVMKQAEEYGDVPGTAMPTINLLIDLAKWGQKRGTKPKIIKDLCKKYDLDPKNIKNFDDLNTAGIPSDEIEFAYSHAIAKTDNPSLVRYLESVRKDLADEILNHFSELNKALKGQYQLLLPAETILKNPPTQLEYVKPKFFRKTGSIFADFESGMVYVRDNEIKEISDAILRSQGVLLIGKAATGKSVLVRTLAFIRMKEGKQIKFVELKKESVELYKLIEETHKLGKESQDALLIIEDAHLNPQIVNSYLGREHQEWPKLLITSRTAEPKLHGESINHFNSLYHIDLKPFDPAEKIIELYFKFKENEGWKLDKKIVEDTKKYSKESLWVLSYALKSLNDTNGIEIHEESILKRVEGDLENLKLTPSNLNDTTKNLFLPTLISLSILYRYEIPTDMRFLVNWINYPNEFELKSALDELVKMGEAFTKKANGFNLYGLPHSALAELYYKYGLKSSSSKYVYAEKFVSDYVIAIDAVNSLELFKYRIREGTLPIREMLTDFPNKIDTQKLAANIAQTTDIYGVGRCILSILEANADAGKKLCDAIDTQKLATNIAQSTDIFDVGWCIQRIFSASADAGKKLWDTIDTQKLAINIAQSDNLANAGDCIEGIYFASADAGRKLCDTIDMQKLAANIAQSTHIRGVALCIENIFKANADASRKLCDTIDMQKLAANIAQSTDLLNAGSCIGTIFDASADAGRKLCDAIDMQNLAANIVQSIDLLGAGWCIENIFNASADAGKKLWGAIDMQKLAAIIEQSSNLDDAGDCIECIYKASADAGRKLCDAIDMQNLAANIVQRTDLTGAASCINNIIKASADAGRNITNAIKELKINQEIKELIREVELSLK